MAAVAKRTINHTVVNKNMVIIKEQSYEFAIPFDLDVPPAKTGVLTTRTNNTDGVVTGQTGHGIVSTDKISVFWDGGRRRNVVATVSVNAISITGGAGDNLPAATTAVTIMKQVSNPLVVTGDTVVGIVVFPLANADQVVSLYDGAGTPAEQLGVSLAAGDGYSWYSVDGTTNPLAGIVTATIRVTHADAVNTQKLTGAVLYS